MGVPAHKHLVQTKQIKNNDDGSGAAGGEQSSSTQHT